MLCSISGETPQEPVVVKTSGLVFEHRLIAKYIAEHGKCPVTGEALSEKDLVEVKTVPKIVKPRPPTLASLPSLLATFQNEWDSLMLETFSLKQQYQQVRQELSQALYQHDAACRVIARLVKERDAARNAIATLQMQVGSAPAQSGAMDMDVDQQETKVKAEQEPEENGEGFSSEVISVLDSTAKDLSKQRKKRKPGPGVATPDQVREYKVANTVPSIHSSTSPDVTCMASRDQLLLTGGVDKHVCIYHQEEGKVVATLKGHTKRVNDVAFFGGQDASGMQDGELDLSLGVVSGAADKVVRIWKQNKPGVFKSHLVKDHKDEVTGVSVHPSQQYVATASLDSTWTFTDLNTCKSLMAITSDDVQSGYSAIRFHPDGLILATGTVDAMIRIWDVKSRKNVANFAGHQGSVGSLAFSENGYVLASADTAQSVVKLWDLRKLDNYATIELPDGYKVNTLSWDYSGQYLGVGGTDTRIYQNKTWAQLGVWDVATQRLAINERNVDAVASGGEIVRIE
ncbi:WD40-repeat-containing domain protein [Syncephalis fuscata]|nr:WD40-repeat-containing domain protein [Syncephalis fuscata]